MASTPPSLASMMPGMLALLLYTLLISLYDLRTGKVPNWATLPLLITGILAHFPGTFLLWIVSLFMFFAWLYRQMGAGDAKLWMALFWVLPLQQSGTTPVALFVTLSGTALAQLIFRKITHRPMSGHKSPAAWRTIPFILWHLYVH